MPGPPEPPGPFGPLGPSWPPEPPRLPCLPVSLGLFKIKCSKKIVLRKIKIMFLRMLEIVIVLGMLESFFNLFLEVSHI